MIPSEEKKKESNNNNRKKPLKKNCHCGIEVEGVSQQWIKQRYTFVKIFRTAYQHLFKAMRFHLFFHFGSLNFFLCMHKDLHMCGTFYLLRNSRIFQSPMLTICFSDLFF